MSLLMMARGRGGSGSFYFGAELPRATYMPAFSIPTGTVRSVASGGDLQAALDASVGGDVIVLANGGTWTGSFTWVMPSGTFNPLYIMSQRAYDGSPPVALGTRATSTTSMPTIRTNNAVVPSFKVTGSGRVGARIVDVCLDNGLAGLSRQYMQLGTLDEPNVANQPGNICVDRCIFQGDNAKQIDRQLWVWAENVCVRDSSFFKGFNNAGGDGQNINVSGPSKVVTIDNVYAEGGTEVFLCVSDYASPTDVTLRRSHLTNVPGQLSFSTSKNIIETKGVLRMLVEDCVLGFHESTSAQRTIQLKSNDNTRVGPLTDVVFRNVLVEDSCGLITVYGVDPDTAPAERIVFANVSAQKISKRASGTSAEVAFLTGWVDGVTMRNVTGYTEATDAYSIGGGIFGNTPPLPTSTLADIKNVKVRDCVLGTASARHIGYNDPIDGITNNGGLLAYGGTNELLGNVLIGINTALSAYTGNGVSPQPTAFNDSDLFEDYAAGDLSLKAASPYRTVGVGGAMPGTDYVTLNSRTAGCISGSW